MFGYSKLNEGGKNLPAPAKLPPPSEVSKQKSQSDRIATFITGLGTKANVDPGCLSNAEPFIKMAIKFFLTVAPIYKKFYTEAYKIYVQLPMNVLTMIFGVALCFFGGTYVASIAAIEAARQLGWQKVVTEVTVVREQLQIVYAASAEDDKVDEDGDGVADVDQLEATELAQRKLRVAMKAVTEPNRLQEAFGALFASYLAVLATLRLEFARTTAFALGIVETVKVPIVRLMSPVVVAILAAAPPDMKLDAEATVGWAITIVESALTLFAVIFAWYLQMIISAFYAGLRGGRIFGDAVCQLLVDYGLMAWVPLVAQPFVPEESYLDEFVGYSTAFCGFCFQFFSGFTLPFPLNIIFLPLTLIEWFLRIQISMSDVGVH